MKSVFLIAGSIVLSFFLNGCVQVTPYPSGGGQPGPPAPPDPPKEKMIDKVFNLGSKNKIRIHVTGKSRDPNKYRICIRNSASGKNKGLDWKTSRKKPVFIARKRNSVTCGEYKPKVVTWTLYEKK